MLTLDQCRGHGLARTPVERLLAAGHWHRMAPGLVRTGAEEPPWLAWAWGGVLLGGPAARLGAAASAYLYGLTEPPAQVVVLVSRDARRVSRPPWVFVQDRAARRPGTGAPPRLRVEDAVLDLAAELDERGVVGLVTQAVQTRRTTSAALRRRLQERGHVRHRALLAALLGDVAQGAESPLEVGYLRQVERPHGLPRGVRQQRRIGQVRDVGYEAYAVVVELDGRLGHDGTDRFRDMWRDNATAASGEVTLRYGFGDVTTRPCEVAAQVAVVLRGRGWTGLGRSCPRCQRAGLW
ncbi:MAG: hypothetical protein JWP61_1282 [Friedmanniella sp.]|nr:hypothetical protein [Friedmanniella sp.]